MLSEMDPITITLLLLVVALVLFASEKIPVDVVGIILVIGLIMSGILNVQEGLQGFGDNIIITIAGLFVLTGGLIKTGLVDLIGRRLYRVAGHNEFFLTTLIMVVAAVCASVLKNTTTTAMFLPVVIGLSERAKIPPSKLLMPLAFGAILGGSCTLIGTSTNLAVSSTLARYQQSPDFPEHVKPLLEPFSMFELTAVGAAAAVAGLIYMLVIGLRLLPTRGGEESFTEQYQIREYISEVLVLPGSHLIGKTLGEADINRELDLNVLGIIRGKEEKIAPSARERIELNDLLIVEGKIVDILRIKSEAGLEIKPDFKLNDRVLEGGDVELFEVMVMRDSFLVGQSLKSVGFRNKYNLTVLAATRHNETIFEKLSTMNLRFGDVLLVQGRRANIEPLVTSGDL
ncbi:MAG TPA: SLC13 family permease, partial [Pyrinomonadaceae bacterium]|nr:SLC13 family permease [Pyrinomonadaceae bacterium]